MTGKRKTFSARLPLIAVVALTAGVVLSAGSASAKYQWDGAVQDGATGGWITPDDGICIVGLHDDGTVDVADGIETKRDCIYLNKGTMNGGTAFDLTGYTTKAACENAVAAGKAKHQWLTGSSSRTAYSCTDSSGYGISLKDLDRTQKMCEAKGGTWNTYPISTPAQGLCVAYTWEYRGQDAAGVPLTFSTNMPGDTGNHKGTESTQNVGFCYTTVRLASYYTGSPACPSTSTNASTSFGHGATNCTYSYGIKGYLNAALTGATGATATLPKCDGTGNTSATLGTCVDLSGITTYGECKAAGASWTNWGINKNATASVATTPDASTIATFDLTRQAVNADEGCLHCHSSVDQANGPAERQKNSYLKTGHKNMLRKVTAGMTWSGPDATHTIVPYTAYAGGTLDFGTLGMNDATAQVSLVDKPLLYIFADWMAPAPSGLHAIVDMGIGTGAKYDGTGNYGSCSPCHTTGWSKIDPAAGLCSLSSKTTSAACTTAGGTWYPMKGVQGIGTPGYTAQEPAASFPSINFNGAGEWDLDGITCARCHNATVPAVTATHIAADIYSTTYPTASGMGNIPSGPDAGGTYATFLCYSCHQSVAKTSNGTGADADLNAPEALPVKNTAVAPAYVPGLSGHVIGGSFLNSVHARATATIQPNSLGKYDIKTATYASAFKGYTCWQSSSSTSPAMTWIDTTLTTQLACEAVHGEWSSGKCIREIKDKTKCESLYGAGAWRAASQGSCVTCHDVHKSLFVAGEEGLRKECTSCHDNADYAAAVPAAKQINLATINHLGGTGTPLEHMGTEPDLACETCHMPKPTSGDFPMHVWRINTKSTYSTFPTALEFGIGGTATRKIANTDPDGTYTNAVWVDIDLACGQCHGGSAGPTATKNGALYRTKDVLAAVANGIHDSAPITYPVTFASFVGSGADSLKVTVTASVACSSGCPTFEYDWQWGDGSTGPATTQTTNHTYAAKGSCSLGPIYTTKAACEAEVDGRWSESYEWMITLTVKADGKVVGSAKRSVRVYNPDAAPVASGTCAWDANTWTATVTSTSTDTDATPIMKVIVDWGDTATSVGSGGAPLTHTYLKAGGPYTVTLKAVDTALQSDGPVTLSCTPGAPAPTTFTIDGTVNDHLAAPLPAAIVTVKKGTSTVKMVYTAAITGAFHITGLKPDTYTLTVAKAKYTFADPAATVTVGPSKTGGTAITINAVGGP